MPVNAVPSFKVPGRSNMNFWIFTVVDAPIGDSSIRATDVLALRCRRLYWLLNSRSPNFRRLKRDDKVVFYCGGKEGGGVFRGICTLSSEPQRIPPDIKRYVVEDPEDKFNYSVNLKEIDLFTHPKSVSRLLGELGFIKDKTGWWRHFQGSIISIPEEDFYTILNHSE